MEEFGVKTYENNKVKIRCATCGNVTEANVPKDSKFVATFNEYENLNISCGICSTILVINMNIPESDYEEFELEAEEMPFFEINARKQIRDMMFEHREDLKKLKKEEKLTRRSAKKEEKLGAAKKMSRLLLNEKADKAAKKLGREGKKKGAK